MNALLPLLIHMTSSPGMAASTGWESKATASERAASSAVGGFTVEDRRLYHQGLEHVYHRHQHLGGFTIRQVVEQERVREAARARLRPRRDVQSTDSSSGGTGFAGIFVILAVLGGGFFLIARGRRGARIVPSESFDDTPYRLGPLTPISPGNIIPHPGETFYWSTSAEALGEIHHRGYVRGNAGVSVRVMRGVYVHSGGSRGHSVDEVGFGVLDRGQLFLSNVRLLFVGSSGKVGYAGYKRIVSVETFHAGFKVLLDMGAPMTFNTGSMREEIILRRLIAGDTADHRPKNAPLSSEGSGTLLDVPAAERTDQQSLLIYGRDRVQLKQWLDAGEIDEEQLP